MNESVDESIEIKASEWLISEYNNYIISLEENGFKCKFCLTFTCHSYLDVVKHIHIKHFRETFLIRFPKYRKLIVSNNNNNNNNNNKEAVCQNETFKTNDNDKSVDKLDQNQDKNKDIITFDIVTTDGNNRQDNEEVINEKSSNKPNDEKKFQNSRSRTNRSDIIREQINSFFNKVAKVGKRNDPKSVSKGKSKKKKKIKPEKDNKQPIVNRLGYIKRITRDNKYYYQCCWSECQYESEVIDKCLLDHIMRHQKSDSVDIKKVKDNLEKGSKRKLDEIDVSSDVKVVKLVVRSDAKNSIIYND